MDINTLWNILELFPFRRKTRILEAVASSRLQRWKNYGYVVPKFVFSSTILILVVSLMVLIQFEEAQFLKT